ncbi:Phosphoglycerol transferase MdoB [Pseudomonas pohangensis]|uniref:Phosphoglycerol transferase MdoB n=1 Tax=Pseudomonas pohangensis TaxID=364197 RepID=A0A1H2EGG5_9PSED|nr:LTA synthase family protein [Pseudomonas pohangensis]SDT94134.1 Phosphoglycerol transferase MdoB [Pseudomonas pohangensis]
MKPLGHLLSSRSLSGLALISLLVGVPLFSRHSLGWWDHAGVVSDLGIGLLLALLLFNRSRLLVAIVLAAWAVMLVGSVELVAAVGRMPEPGDLQYLLDPQFVGNTTHGGKIAHPLLLAALAGGILLCVLLGGHRQAAALPRWLYLLPAALLGGHALDQFQAPSEAAQWQQFNLPHKLLAEELSAAQRKIEGWLSPDDSLQAADMLPLTALDLSGSPLLESKGKARNVLIITLEGIPGAYIATSRAALSSSYPLDPMPKLSQWAARAMTTPDYVLHGHQTIRGLYAMLCGDYNKFDSGTPKGLELLNNPQRAAQCLPAQLHAAGYSTHFLQGAGLRFMAKDRIMPQMGFDKTLGRNWFPNKAYIDFPWGMDDKAFFEGTLLYVKQLRKKKQPWMLTLMTVGTHQPYSAPDAYLQRYPDAKTAAIAYLDDAVASFLSALERQGVLKDTLVIITSDESHGIEKQRLASAWGFNLLLAPEQAQLPAVKSGVYGHVDLTATILDYLRLPMPENISGRSLLRNYSSGRQMLSYTNGMLRKHDGQGHFIECDFQQICRSYASSGFIADQARFLGRSSRHEGRLLAQQSSQLDQSLLSGEAPRQYQFATRERINLKQTSRDDWADNLIGAQYLELPKGSHTTVKLSIRALNPSATGALFQLKTKEFDREVQLPIPALPVLDYGTPMQVSFGFDNDEGRKAFSFHLLAQGQGAIEISDFSINTELLAPLVPGSISLDSSSQ